jgi:hypothetical protein
VRQVRQRGTHARMQMHATGLVVFGAATVNGIDWETDVAAYEIEVTPVEPQGFADACAGVEQKDHKWTEVLVASLHEAISFLRRDPTHTCRWLLRTLHNDL